jgi:aminopeptidase N
MPCVDHPNQKAHFTLSVVVECPEHIAISNTPVKSITGNVYEFERTPLMSTYLLACIVGKFGFWEATSTKGV